MSKFEYKEGDEFELSASEQLTKAGEILAAGGTYSLKGKILKITSLPEEKESKKAETKKTEEKKAEEPKAAEESKDDDEKKSTRGSKPKAETSDDKE